MNGSFSHDKRSTNGPGLTAFGRFFVMLVSSLALALAAPTAHAKESTSQSKHASKSDSKKKSKSASKTKGSTKSTSAKRAPDTLFSAARAGKWADARRLANAAKDPIAPLLANWLYVSDPDVQPSFDEINDFLRDHPGWPARSAMLSKAEQAIPDTMGPSQIVAWFGTREPKTGIGMVRLGESKLALGDKTGGEALIRRAWAQEDFASSDEGTVASRHAALLAGAPTAARLDRFLASRRTTDATRTMAFADADTRELAEARLAMQRSPSKAASLAAALPARLRDDPGLVMEEMRALRTASDYPQALALAGKASAPKAGEHWWPERVRLAREALDLGRYQDAYQLASAHGLEEGPDFADAEWLAGWIALRFLEKPDTGLKHFRTLYTGVSYPVSKSRAAYWAGRSAEAAGKLSDAAAYYAVAANYNTTYYGQLAAAALGGEKTGMALPEEPTPSPSMREKFKNDEVARVARYASAAGEDGVARRFLLHLADRATSPEEYVLAGRLASDLGYPNYAVRIAKTAMQNDVVLTEISYPLISGVKASNAGGVETALMLGLSRQESEFNPKAMSSAGARGLMQLMPKTAQVTAKKIGLSYSPQKLDDPVYNTKLGTVYLGDLIDSFNGSYVLAIASYNAGPSRARDWIRKNGDPRDPKVDPVDWVERIPFSETRNYVQRVLENTQVYRGRLASAQVPIRVREDIARPNGSQGAQRTLISYLKPDAEQTILSVKELAVAEPEPEPGRKQRWWKSKSEPAAPAVVVASDTPAPTPILTPPPTTQPAADLSAAAKPVEVAPAPPVITLAPPPKKRGNSDAVKVAEVSLEKQLPAAPPPPAAVTNPFDGGQPETHEVDKSCRRMILGSNGKVKCADK